MTATKEFLLEKNQNYKESMECYSSIAGSRGPALLFENLIWLSTEEAARLLRRSSHALRQLVYKGKIRPRKFGGRLYFKRSELDELIETSFY